MHTFLSDNVVFRIANATYPLSIFIDHFILMEGNNVFTQRRIFPNNKSEVFFNLGELIVGKNILAIEDFNLKESVLSGVRKSYFDFKPGSNFSMAGIRFTLFGFNLLFNIPAQHFTNKDIMLPDIWGREVELIREQLLEASSPESKIEVLEKWVYSKTHSINVNNVLQWKKLENLIASSQTPVKVIADKLLGFSHKHSIQIIKEKSGLAPKTIQKINRFKYSIKLLSKATPSQSTIAYEAGYADQSHFIREFKSFTGFTPLNYLKEKPLFFKNSVIEEIHD